MWRKFKGVKVYGILSMVLILLTAYCLLVTGCGIIPGKITGQITNSSGGAGIDGANISAGGQSGSTSGGGSYTLNNVLSKSQTVTASATGYQSNSITVTVPPGGSVTANIALTPVPIQNGDFSLGSQNWIFTDESVQCPGGPTPYSEVSYPSQQAQIHAHVAYGQGTLSQSFSSIQLGTLTFDYSLSGSSATAVLAEFYNGTQEIMHFGVLWDNGC